MNTRNAKPTSRRHFLRAGATLGVASPLALGWVPTPAAAQAATDYRALVCLYLGGGNDHLSTVVPFDTASYNHYLAVRGGLALSRASLLPLPAASAQGERSVAFNPALTGLKALYDAGRCAVLANVGPMLRATTQAEREARRVALPSQLGSHNDQSDTWQSLATSAPFGWGGLMGDLLASRNRKTNFTTVSANGGYSPFLVGAQTSFFTVSESGAPRRFFTAGSPLEAVVTGSAQRSNLLEQAYAQVHEQLRDGADDLRDAMLPESALPAAPGSGRNPLANQLLAVARIIGGRTALGVKRQLFFVDMGGFDTHSAQHDRHPVLMTQLNDALTGFDAAMGQIGTRNNVTLFTTSEFGRTYSVNGNGTDHGWGSHHLVMGGAVKGGNIYGNLPDMAPNGPDFLNGSSMIPSVSIEQYGATLARWMGIDGAGLDTVFARLGGFSSRNLGFLIP